MACKCNVLKQVDVQVLGHSPLLVTASVKSFRFLMIMTSTSCFTFMPVSVILNYTGGGGGGGGGGGE